MKSFMEKHWDNIPPDLNVLLKACDGCQSKEKLWENQRPEVLESLRKSAIIESSVSSNRMEGVDIDDQRALKLFDEKNDERSYEEVLGYKDALNWINVEYATIPITIETIKKLHNLCFKSEMNSDAGQFKKSNKPIREQLGSGEWINRFNPVEVADTEPYLNYIIEKYKEWNNDGVHSQLLLISAFILDFLCIHPFRDGNGRTARLLTLLLLFKSSFNVGRYISLERLIENTKDEKKGYYDALKKSSGDKWHKSEHDIMHWHRYFVALIRDSYREMENRVATHFV
ncbi:MAG: hypothetical protein E2O68_00655 [Deltaproteobacteria bacterium]|nr:MAG: hypothetical protein E2O68_00655 [Deltaproteobacteria bacterium]